MILRSESHLKIARRYWGPGALEGQHTVILVIASRQFNRFKNKRV